MFHWIDPPKNSQNFVEKAHNPDATPLKNFYKNSFNSSLKIIYDLFRLRPPWAEDHDQMKSDETIKVEVEMIVFFKVCFWL